MTTSTSSPRPLRLTDPGDLIAAVPAMLGFLPARSLIVLSLASDAGGGRDGARSATVGAVMRHDLILPPGEDDPVPAAMRDVFDRFGALCDREGADAVLVVLVDDRLDHPDAPAVAAACRLLDDFAVRLDRRGVRIAGAHAVSEVACGRTWFALVGGARGTVPDPQASPVAAARVFEGGAIRRSRAELADLLTPLPMPGRMQVADHIDEAIDARDLAYELAVRAGGRDRADRQELEAVLAHIARHDDGAELLAPELAELAVLLSNSTVRDAVMALAAGAEADTAERLWVTLTRRLPDPERAEAAALVGYSAYVRGDGPLAGVALGVALESNPRHRLADLLDQALQAGLRPHTVRGLADTGYEIAARLGVRMPPPEPAA